MEKKCARKKESKFQKFPKLEYILDFFSMLGIGLMLLLVAFF